MSPFLAPVIILFYGLCWRFRGMSHPSFPSWYGTQVNRVVAWVIPATASITYFAWYNGYPLYYAAASAVLIFIDAVIGHSKWQDDVTRSYWGMSWISGLRIFLMLLPFFEKQPQLMLLPLLGMLAWPACWLGYKMNAWGLRLSTFGFVWCDPTKGSEWEEFFIGLLPYGTVFSVLMS